MDRYEYGFPVIHEFSNTYLSRVFLCELRQPGPRRSFSIGPQNDPLAARDLVARLDEFRIGPDPSKRPQFEALYTTLAGEIGSAKIRRFRVKGLLSFAVNKGGGLTPDLMIQPDAASKLSVTLIDASGNESKKQLAGSDLGSFGLNRGITIPDAYPINNTIVVNSLHPLSRSSCCLLGMDVDMKLRGGTPLPPVDARALSGFSGLLKPGPAEDWGYAFDRVFIDDYFASTINNFAKIYQGQFRNMTFEITKLDGPKTIEFTLKGQILVVGIWYDVELTVSAEIHVKNNSLYIKSTGAKGKWKVGLIWVDAPQWVIVYLGHFDWGFDLLGTIGATNTLAGLWKVAGLRGARGTCYAFGASDAIPCDNAEVRLYPKSTAVRRGSKEKVSVSNPPPSPGRKRHTLRVYEIASPDQDVKPPKDLAKELPYDLAAGSVREHVFGYEGSGVKTYIEFTTSAGIKRVALEGFDHAGKSAVSRTHINFVAPYTDYTTAYGTKGARPVSRSVRLFWRGGRAIAGRARLEDLSGSFRLRPTRFFVHAGSYQDFWITFYPGTRKLNDPPVTGAVYINASGNIHKITLSGIVKRPRVFVPEATLDRLYVARGVAEIRHMGLPLDIIRMYLPTSPDDATPAPSPFPSPRPERPWLVTRAHGVTEGSPMRLNLDGNLAYDGTAAGDCAVAVGPIDGVSEAHIEVEQPSVENVMLSAELWSMRQIAGIEGSDPLVGACWHQDMLLTATANQIRGYRLYGGDLVHPAANWESPVELTGIHAAGQWLLLETADEICVAVLGEGNELEVHGSTQHEPGKVAVCRLQGGPVLIAAGGRLVSYDAEDLTSFEPMAESDELSIAHQLIPSGDRLLGFGEQGIALYGVGANELTILDHLTSTPITAVLPLGEILAARTDGGTVLNIDNLPDTPCLVGELVEASARMAQGFMVPGPDGLWALAGDPDSGRPDIGVIYRLRQNRVDPRVARYYDDLERE